jgi:regulator of protease activity HflC (stomatin/prohibitin superfamily)
VGTVARAGFHWVNPLTTRRNLSLRLRNLDTDVLKVNDTNGNPIEISAMITWQVQDAAQAAFDVEDYLGFVDIQAEIAADMLRRQQADAIMAGRLRDPGVQSSATRSR